MTQEAPRPLLPRGGAAVGFLNELPEVERAAVLFLRKWCDGDEARAVIARDFAHVFGPQRGADLTLAQDHLMRLMLSQTRRPMMRHADGCACLGGDEAAFAQLVASAAAGDAEDAALFAMTLIAGPAVPQVVRLAEQLGLAYADIFTPFTLTPYRPHRRH